MKDTNVYYVGGSKGGVGKSLFAFALVDYLLERGQNVLLVDTDTDNPDVYKAHVSLGQPNLQCRMNSLDDADGWADLLDTVQEYSDHAVVINAAARTKTSTASYGEIMKSALVEMGRELMVFWIINRHRDSVELLHSFMEAFPETTIHVCRNLYFGEANRFDIYNNSRAKITIEQRGMTLNFPTVANRVADWLYSKRCSIQNGTRRNAFRYESRNPAVATGLRRRTGCYTGGESWQLALSNIWNGCAATRSLARNTIG